VEIFRTKKELDEDFRKYSDQLELFDGRSQLSLQEAYTKTEVQVNRLTTLVLLQQLDIRELQDRLDNLLKNPWQKD
jgi:hypothetical protein